MNMDVLVDMALKQQMTKQALGFLGPLAMSAGKGLLGAGAKAAPWLAAGGLMAGGDIAVRKALQDKSQDQQPEGPGGPLSVGKPWILRKQEEVTGRTNLLPDFKNLFGKEQGGAEGPSGPGIGPRKDNDRKPSLVSDVRSLFQRPSGWDLVESALQGGRGPEQEKQALMDEYAGWQQRHPVLGLASRASPLSLLNIGHELRQGNIGKAFLRGTPATFFMGAPKTLEQNADKNKGPSGPGGTGAGLNNPAVGGPRGGATHGMLGFPKQKEPEGPKGYGPPDFGNTHSRDRADPDFQNEGANPRAPEAGFKLAEAAALITFRKQADFDFARASQALTPGSYYSMSGNLPDALHRGLGHSLALTGVGGLVGSALGDPQQGMMTGLGAGLGTQLGGAAGHTLADLAMSRYGVPHGGGRLIGQLGGLGVGSLGGLIAGGYLGNRLSGKKKTKPPESTESAEKQSRDKKARAILANGNLLDVLAVTMEMAEKKAGLVTRPFESPLLKAAQGVAGGAQGKPGGGLQPGPAPAASGGPPVAAKPGPVTPTPPPPPPTIGGPPEAAKPAPGAGGQNPVQMPSPRTPGLAPTPKEVPPAPGGAPGVARPTIKPTGGFIVGPTAQLPASTSPEMLGG